MVCRSSRRGFLASLALSSAALAGCREQSAPETESTTTQRNPVNPSSPESTTATPLPDSFRWTAEISRPATAEQPPELSVTLENTGERTVELFGGGALPFSVIDASIDTATTAHVPALVLHHPDYSAFSTPSDPVGGCWRLPDDTMLAALAIGRIETLAPGDAVSESYDVYGHPENDDTDDVTTGADDITESHHDCFPDGDYTFSNTLDDHRGPGALELACTVTVENGVLDSVSTPSPTVTT